MDTPLPDHADRPRRPARKLPLLLLLGGAALAVAAAFAAVVWLGFQSGGTGRDGPIPEAVHHPDDAVVTIVAESPEAAKLLDRALAADNGGHFLTLRFGENRLPAGKYQLVALDVPVRAEFEPPVLHLARRQTATARVKLVK